MNDELTQTLQIAAVFAGLFLLAKYWRPIFGPYCTYTPSKIQAAYTYLMPVCVLVFLATMNLLAGWGN